MITVTFLNGCILATAEQSLWQYSYNQQLQINGLELSGVFTVDFCNEGDTTTVAMIGSSGVVDIPNELLTSGRDIVAYVFQKSTLTGGITRCEIRIDVLTRPERDDETPTPEQEAVIDQYIAELNEGVEQAETAAANAQTSENNAAASAADAQQSKADAAASASAAAGSASDASNSAAAAAQSAVNASNSAEDAAEAASEGIGYKEDSEAWAIGKRGGVDVGSSDETYHNNSKYYAGQAAASSSAANSEAAASAQSARDAAASATGAAQSAASATASKNAAANSADVAANAATAAQNHSISAASSATAASGSATAAANKATAAAQSATAAGNSATEAATAREAAEDAQDAAEAAAQSIAQSAAQIAQNTSDIADLKDAVDTLQPAATAADIGKALIVKTVADGKPTEYEYGEAGGGGDASNYAPIIINSASGDIASFTDGADGLPVKALSVNVEPIQDLHGYESPWPAGGGKNKLSLGTVNVNANQDFSVTPIPAGTYVFSTLVTSTNTDENVVIVFKDASGTTLVSKSITPNTGARRYTSSFTTNTEIAKVTLYSGNGRGGAQGNSSVWTDTMITEGSTEESYSPYSNICPISGRTSATVTRTGKNLLSLPTIELGGSNPRTKYISIGTIPPGTYRFSAVRSGTATDDFGVQFIGIDGSIVGRINIVLTNVTLTAPANMVYAYMSNADYSVGKTHVLFDMQLELGSTASAYDPYAGNTYTITLGDTVYGGTLDVVTGVLTIDWTLINLADFVASMNDNGIRSGNQLVALSVTGKNPGTFNFISNIFVKGSTISDYKYTMYGRETTATVEFGIPLVDLGVTEDDPVATRMAAAKQWFTDNPTQLCYELATPIEITLTPTQIDTLLGTNNVWSDAGDVSVDYRADTKLYIDNIHTPTDDDMTADAQIASGKYFLIGGTLYKSTTVIPAGDTIRPGTNCVKTNLAEALNALNA